MPQSITTLTNEYSISWLPLIAQVMNFSLIIIYILILVLAVLRVARKGKGIEVPIWIIVIAVIPVLGVIGAFTHYKRQ